MAGERAYRCALAHHDRKAGQVTLYRAGAPACQSPPGNLSSQRQANEILLVNDAHLIAPENAIHSTNYFHTPLRDLFHWWWIRDLDDAPGLDHMLESLNRVLAQRTPDVTEPAISGRLNPTATLTLPGASLCQTLLNAPWGEGEPEPVPATVQPDDNAALLFQAWEMPGWVLTEHNRWLAVPLAARIALTDSIHGLYYHPRIATPTPRTLVNDYQSLSPAFGLMLLAECRQQQARDDDRAHWMTALEQCWVLDRVNELSPEPLQSSQIDPETPGIAYSALGLDRAQWLDTALPGRAQRQRLSVTRWRNLLNGADRMAGQPLPLA